MSPSQKGSSSANEPNVQTAEREAASAFAAAKGICRSNLGSYYWAAMFLPLEKRKSAYAIAALLQMIHEVIQPADSAPPSACGSTDSAVLLVRDRLDDVYADRLDLPQPQFRSAQQHVLLAAEMSIRRYAIPKEMFDEFVIGLQRDTTTRRYATWNALESHCQGTGGAAARIIGCVLGFTHSQGSNAISKLGCGVRLTQILSNVFTDSVRGRIYLPLEDLARFHYSERELLGLVTSGAFHELMQFQIDRAGQFFDDGSAVIRWLASDGSRVATAMVVQRQREILATMRRKGRDPKLKNARFNIAQHLRILAGAWSLARRTDVD